MITKEDIGLVCELRFTSGYRKHYDDQIFEITGIDKKMINLKYCNKYGDTKAITVPIVDVFIEYGY